MAKKVIASINNQYGIDIKASRIRYGLNKTLIIKDLLIPDQKGDTLFFSKRIEAKIKNIDFNYNKIDIERISIKKSEGFVTQIDSNKYNFSFIVDTLQKKTAKRKNWKINCDKLLISNHKYTISTHTERLFFENVYLHIKDFSVDTVHQELQIVSFSSELNNHPLINKLQTKIKKKNETLTITDFSIQANTSNINIPEANFILPHKNKLLTYKVKIASSKIFLNDLYFLKKRFDKQIEPIQVSGIFNGNNKKVFLYDLSINICKNTDFEGNVNIYNFTNIDELSYDLNVTKLITSKNDINNILTNFINQDSIHIPPQYENIGKLWYIGSLRGTKNNISLKGSLLSHYGKILTDFNLKKEKFTEDYSINGNINGQPIFLDKITKNEDFGEVKFNIKTQGKLSKKTGIDLDIFGSISTFSYKQQYIDSITVKGKLTKNKFIGRISSFDPRIRFDFEGLIDYNSTPSYNFILNLYSADLVKLGIDKKNNSSNLSLNLKANFVGNSIDNVTGDVTINDLFFFKDTSYFATDSISFTSYLTSAGKKELLFYSEFVEGSLYGKYNTLTLVRDIEAFINYHTPALEITKKENSGKNIFNFNIIANYPHPITELFLPGFRISPGTNISGEFNSKNNTAIITGSSDHIKFNNKIAKSINLKAYSRNNQFYVNIDSKELKYSDNYSLKNFLASAQIKNDSIYLNYNWNNWLEKSYSGNVNSILSLTKGQEKLKPYLKLNIYPSNIIVLDTLWYLKEGFIAKDSSGLTVHNLEVNNGFASFSIRGKLTDNPTDSIEVSMNRISMEHLNVLLNKDKLKFQGYVSGHSKISDIKGERKLNIDFYIKDFGLNGEEIGNMELKTSWNKDKKIINVNGINYKGEQKTLSFEGDISPSNHFIDITAELNKQQFDVLTPYLKPAFQNLEGELSGKIRVFGDYTNPSWEGAAYGNNVKLMIEPTNVYYTFSDSVYFNDHHILFRNLTLNDRDQNSAILNGNIVHSEFTDFSFDLKIATPRILGINTSSIQNPLFYGTVYGAGLVDINGPANKVVIAIVATTSANSYFYIPLEGKSDLTDNDFIEFISKRIVDQTSDKQEEEKEIKQDVITTLKADLTVTDDVEIQIIFDPRIGDALKAHGTARLNLESVGDEFSMFGEYRINRGDFVFTLQNVINKRLEIQSGSTVSFTGHPLDAEINVDAVYKIRKASVYELTGIDDDKEKRVEVNCHLLMTNKLVNPTISFAVDVPTATNDEAIDQLNNLPTEELNKQVLSLLLVNKFISLNPSLSSNTGSNAGGLGATTASEILSNQLSNWLSQVTSIFDLGFSYRPGDDYTAQEYELALTTKLWNERVIVNGNVGFAGQGQQSTTSAYTTNNNPYTTDFQVELKVNQKGNIRLRAFQKANNDFTYNTGNPYTQGLGIFYTEEFDNFDELLRKMFRFGTPKKPED
ncbi:MAG: translocation/assembly module TamB domain-containing protein [Salinivirgaceae bacterium]|nr:translocation/assembly module TamB domain-containing protein [Salinivirgaceae bacterium]